MQGASMLTLYAILIVAVVQDLKFMRISNRLIVMGLFLSVAFGIFLGGMPRIIDILLNISFPVIVLYLLYLLGVLGAGDIKLFSVVGGFTNFKTLTGCMLAAFAVAAVLSVGKMLYNRNLGFSLFKGQLFVKEVLQGNISSYRKTRAEERNLLHFSVTILIGLLLVRGYGHLH
jgi:prepilin peptidase CpaA